MGDHTILSLHYPGAVQGIYIDHPIFSTQMWNLPPDFAKKQNRAKSTETCEGINWYRTITLLLGGNY